MKLNRIVCLTTLTLAVIGCKVDSSYDFSELDTTMTVLKGAEFPVPSVQLKLKDVYPLDDFDYVQVDGAGNYLIRFDCDPIEVSVEFPESPAFDGDRIPIDFDPVVYHFDGVPELLSGHDPSVLVDLSEMVVTMAVNSTLPAAFSVHANLEAVRSGAVTTRCPVDNLGVSAYGREIFNLVAKDHSDLEGDIVIPGLDKLLNPIPNSLIINDMEIFSPASERAKIESGQTYKMDCRTFLESPIIFSEGTRFHGSMPIDAQLDLEQIGLKKAVLSVGIENSLPLDFSFSLDAYDADGNRLTDVQIAPDFDKISGLSQTTGSITLTSKDDLRFSSLRLELTASVLADNPHDRRTYLNERQGLFLSNMVLSLPEGIEIHLDSPSK